MAKFNATIRNNNTGKEHTTPHPARRSAAQSAAMALHDNNPRMTRAEANKAFTALLSATTDRATATYGHYTATVDKA